MYNALLILLLTTSLLFIGLSIRTALLMRENARLKRQVQDLDLVVVAVLYSLIQNDGMEKSSTELKRVWNKIHHDDNFADEMLDIFGELADEALTERGY